MSAIKIFIKHYFPWIANTRNRLVNRWKAAKYRAQPMQEVFTSIYQDNYWGDQESKSGPGSNKEQTAVVRGLVEKVIEDYAIKTMLDIPCGDFNWMRDVNRKDCIYTGGDIVQNLIEHNAKKYRELHNVSFIHINLATSVLPVNDLLFCRDCLVHFSYDAIWEALINIKKSTPSFFLTTTFPDHTNRDIITGDWRPLNLEKPPFNFPKPIMLYNEQCTEENGRYKDKSLAIWYGHQIPDRVA